MYIWMECFGIVRQYCGSTSDSYWALSWMEVKELHCFLCVAEYNSGKFMMLQLDMRPYFLNSILEE